MSEIKVIIDGKEYTQEKYKKDITRMFDMYLKDSDCNDIFCWHCPLHDELCNTPCKVTNVRNFDLIKFVYEWSQKNPVVTNRDKMIETFGGAYFNLIINYVSDASLEDYDAWLNDEYKEPDNND